MGKVKKINIEGLLRWHDTFLSEAAANRNGSVYATIFLYFFSTHETLTVHFILDGSHF